MTRSEITQNYFNNNLEIKVGDRFSEMLSFFITVVKILDTGEILTIESNKEDIQVYKSSEDFRYKCSYKSKGMEHKYWIDYFGNFPEKSQQLLNEWKSVTRYTDKVVGKRQIRIDEILYNL